MDRIPTGDVVKQKFPPAAILKRLFRAKAERRRWLAQLPLEKKIQILVELQKVARGVDGGRRRLAPSAWKIRP